MGFFPWPGAIARVAGVSVVTVVYSEGDWNSANRFLPSFLEDSSTVSIFLV